MGVINWGQIPIIRAQSHPPWGRIFLVFRSKNGPQAVRLDVKFWAQEKIGI
jgi:hypothetical protein